MINSSTALPRIRNFLDTSFVSLEAPARAFEAGMHMNYFFDRAYRQLHQVSTKKSEFFLSHYLLGVVNQLVLIHAAKRLKLFENSRWEKPFVVGVGAMVLLKGLAYYKNGLRKPFPQRLGEIVDVFDPQNAISPERIITIAFAVFEFYNRPREILIGCLGGYIIHLSIKYDVVAQVGITSFVCISSVKFYCGDKFERAYIAVIYLAQAYFAYNH